MTHDNNLTAAGLAHDLNNVFQTLISVAANLEHEPELAAAILRSVERGQQIVLGLGHNSAPATSFDAILTNAVAFFEDFQLAAKDPRVEIVSEVETGIALAGHWAWERVLINLFLNSLRAMPAGGTISVRARHRTSDVTGEMVEIAVADEGTGIAAEMLDKLFEPHASGHGSTGLGLSIVDSIVRANGGRIHARNLTRGAEFTINVPNAAKFTVAQAAGASA